MDLNAEHGGTAVQMQPLESEGRRANRLRKLTIYHSADSAANNDQDMQPQGEHCAALFASSMHLRSLCIDDARSILGACFAAIRRPGLLQTLRFGTGIPTSPLDWVSHIACFENLREISFPDEDPAEAESLLCELTRVFPLLRTASFESSTMSGNHVTLMIEVAVAEGLPVTWSRLESHPTTWTRRTALAERSLMMS